MAPNDGAGSDVAVWRIPGCRLWVKSRRRPGQGECPLPLFDRRKLSSRFMQALSQSDDGIEQDLRHSLEFARAHGAKMFELRAAIGLAGLWRRQGKGDKGREFLTPISDWFTEGLDMPDFREAKALLDTLS